MDAKKITQTRERQVYLDALRIFAAFFVIFNHTGDTGFFLFAQRPWGSPAFWIYLFFSVFCKVSVPLFLAISGALMLHKENDPLHILWRKRIGRILLILVLFVLGNYLLDWMRLGRSRTPLELFKIIYTGSSAGMTFWYGHLWYLYMYMAYLCCLPFLRSLVKNLEDKYFYHLIAIGLVVKGVIPAAEYFLSYGYVPLTGNAVPKWLVTDIVLYPCIGYFLQHRMKPRFRDLVLLWAANFAGIAITGLLIYRQAILTQQLNADVSQGFHTVFVLLNCIAVFATAKYVFSRVTLSPGLKKAIHSMGQCSFGIYLFHIMILESQLSGAFLAFLQTRTNALAACFLQCICVFLAGYAVTWLVRKIPCLGKLIS